jgi:sugar O-acyltransferase (sialic acid O-acetyltransferase NeuD family)
MNTTDIIILGIGGNSIDILDTINDINDQKYSPTYRPIGFLDDNSDNWGKQRAGITILGGLNSALIHEGCYFVNGIGSVSSFLQKDAIIAKTQIPLERFATVIHPTASVSRMATIGHGSVVFQNVTITSNVSIGNHVIILPNSIISHDAVVGDYTCVSGGVCISGEVTVGKSCYLGTNAAVRDKISVGFGCLVGMGSVVTSDVEDGSVVLGNPARCVRRTQDMAK